jgi:ppGpp synthetase/RelA/SpoT-type nucleotidyltranferase
MENSSKLSNSQLKKMGKALADGTETSEQLDHLDALLSRCDEIQLEAREVLAGSLSSIQLASGGNLEVRGRAKTLITLREKLVRMGGQTLPVIRDLAGLRIVGDMTIAEQDMVLDHACNALGVSVDNRKIIDRRQNPMRGYRALHAEFKLDEIRVELQVRTQLQHVWAEVYERAGDRLGRSIRYPQDDSIQAFDPQVDDLIRAMEKFSDMGRQIEDLRLQMATLPASAVATDPNTGRIVSVSNAFAGEADIRRQIISSLSGIGQLLDELPAAKES